MGGVLRIAAGGFVNTVLEKAMQGTHLWIGAAVASVALAAAAVDSFGGEAANTAPAAPAGSAQDGVAASVDIKIFCDMEGISGIVFKSFVTNDSDRYAEGQRYLMGDLNACIQGCIEGGRRENYRPGHPFAVQQRPVGRAPRARRVHPGESSAV